MAQPEPARIAQHLRDAADQIALFDNLPVVHEAQTLQNIIAAIAELRAELRRNIEELRQDTNAGFARVEVRLVAIDVNISTV